MTKNKETIEKEVQSNELAKKNRAFIEEIFGRFYDPKGYFEEGEGVRSLKVNAKQSRPSKLRWPFLRLREGETTRIDGYEGYRCGDETNARKYKDALIIEDYYWDEHLVSEKNLTIYL